jgi:predicted hydrocarbon binding protein
LDESQTLRELVRTAHDALAELGRTGGRCPVGVDRFDWSADLLDELARVALEVGEVASTLAGGPDDDVEARARELATAIVRRRNDALIPLRMPHSRVACQS